MDSRDFCGVCGGDGGRHTATCRNGARLPAAVHLLPPSPRLIETRQGLVLRRGAHEAPLTLYAAWREPGGGALWAVGDRGVILRRSGQGGWLLVRAGTERLQAIHGTGPRDIWAVGAQGVILHWDGVLWTPAGPGLGGVDLNGVLSGPQPGHVFVVGDAGMVLVRTAGSWRAEPTGERSRSLTALAVGRDGLWVVGDGGTILLRGVDRRWTRVDSPTTAALYAVAASADDDGVVIVGHQGCVLRRGTRGCFRHEPAGLTGHLFAAAQIPGGWLVAGAGEAASAWQASAWEERDVVCPGSGEDDIFVYPWQDLIHLDDHDGVLAVGSRGGLYIVRPAPAHASIVFGAGR